VAPKGHGGVRPGSGRKPNYLKKLGIAPIRAAELLAHVDEVKIWSALLNDKSSDVRLRALQFLSDKRDGKAVQALAVQGHMLHGDARDYKNLTPAELDAKIAQITEQLGFVEKSLNPPLLLAESVTMDPPVSPQPTPARWDVAQSRPEQPPPSARMPQATPPTLTGDCDKHGPFKLRSRVQPTCPVCSHEWAEQRAADQQHLTGLLPGTPEWK